MRKLAFPLLMLLLGVGAAAAIYVAVRPDPSRPVRRDRDLGLEHASVQMHLVLRQRLAANERAVAEALLASDRSADPLDGLARELFEARHEGARKLAEGEDSGPILEALGAPRRSVDVERATLLLTYLVAHARHEAAASPPVVTYEASRLVASELPEPLRGVANAARTLVYASGGHCERAAEAATASARGPSAEDVAGWLESLEAPTVAADVEHARKLLIDGALACCALRARDRVESARLIEATVRDAQGLGLDDARIRLFQAFAAVARREPEQAREILDSVDPAELEKFGEGRLRLLRDAIAGAGEESLFDAAIRLADRDWLLSAMLEAVVDVLQRDGLLEVLEEQPEVRAARQLVAAEAELFSIARKAYPFFDQAHLRRE